MIRNGEEEADSEERGERQPAQPCKSEHGREYPAGIDVLAPAKARPQRLWGGRSVEGEWNDRMNKEKEDTKQR